MTRRKFLRLLAALPRRRSCLTPGRNWPWPGLARLGRGGIQLATEAIEAGIATIEACLDAETRPVRL